MKNERADIWIWLGPILCLFIKLTLKETRKEGERYSPIHIFMSYSYPTRVVNGYWLRVFFVVLVFRLSNSVSVFILFREWVGPTKVHKNLGTFEEEEAHWVWVSELCRCWFCFYFFYFFVGPHTELGPKSSSAHFRPLLIFNVSNSRLSLWYIYIYI